MLKNNIIYISKNVIGRKIKIVYDQTLIQINPRRLNNTIIANLL